jgi:PBP1b-binding outer membrane lipoprotein LpoB
MKKTCFFVTGIMLLAMLLSGCQKGEIELTIKTPKGPEEPTQPSDIQVGNTR